MVVNGNIFAFQSKMCQESTSLFKVLTDTCCRNVKFIKKTCLLAFEYTMRKNTFLFLFSFQEFEDHRDADDAIYELNGKELCDER